MFILEYILFFRYSALLTDAFHAVSLYRRIGYSDRPTDDRQPFKNHLFDGWTLN